jgi:riboflavin synthase
MFTGLVQATGRVATIDDGRIRVEADPQLELREGDSIAVSGVCLTATEVNGVSFAADVVPETLRRSSLGSLGQGDRVNLELPLRASDRLGGHIVQGHVDAVGTVESLGDDGVLRITASPDALRYVVEKGSIALDGVSLTVAEVDDDGFAVALIPETLERTTLAGLEPGSAVNVEVDVLAKYVEKLVARVGADRA